MKILITGICGFVGSTLAKEFLGRGLKVAGIDNLSRPGSELNRTALRNAGAAFIHGDIRLASDLETLSDVDWIIDAAANPSVLAGVDGKTSSRQLVEHNLQGTINLLEYCKARRTGLILLSTSRVYSIKVLSELKVEAIEDAFCPTNANHSVKGFSSRGISEEFSTTSPVSLYGATKLASEQLALEYGMSYGFPVWINRCGVLAGAGQFGRADQGIFSYWINSWAQNRQLKYVGFGGSGFQVRDGLHPRDLIPLLEKQMAADPYSVPPVMNIGGGPQNSMSLAQLSSWCQSKFGHQEVCRDQTMRAFDIPWMVMDTTLAKETWDWQPQTALTGILEEIAAHAAQHPGWLEISA